MEQKPRTEHKANNTPKEPKQENKIISEHDTEADEIASSELAAKLRSDGRFDVKLTRGHKVGVIAEAILKNWHDWDENTRVNVSGFFIYAYKRRDDFDKGLDVTTLRVLIAAKILDIDPNNALRIIASVVLHGSKPVKPGEINMRLCKALQNHLLQGEIPRYEKIFLSRFKEETKIVLQHIVAAIAGQYSDLKDPAFASKQLQLVTSIINSDSFKLLDQQSVYSLVGAMRSWPISMIDNVTATYELFAAKFPNENNPFANVLPPVLAVMQPASTQPSQEPVQSSLFDPVASSVSLQSICSTPPLPIPTKPEPLPRNLSDPSEVISIVTECMHKLEADIATKKEEIGTLNQTIEQLQAEKQHYDEKKEKKRRALDAVREDNQKLRDEINQLKSTISTKVDTIESLQNEKSKLIHDLASSEEKVCELVAKHEHSVEHLSKSIENVSIHKVNELKKSLEMDLKREFDELTHLPTDENCIFHMDVLKAIFRKLRDKGIDVGGSQQ